MKAKYSIIKATALLIFALENPVHAMLTKLRPDTSTWPLSFARRKKRNQFATFLGPSHRDTNIPLRYPVMSHSKDQQDSPFVTAANAAISGPEVELHLKRQQKQFDQESTYFSSEGAVEDFVKPILTHLMQRAVRRITGNEKPTTKTKAVKIADVGCGTGVLFSYLIEEADKLGIAADITGIDLSPQMSKYAKQHAKKILESNREAQNEHKIDVVTGDFVGLVLSDKEGGAFPGVGHDHRNYYDGVVINACFGNFFDRNAVMSAAAACLRPGGVLCISHPLGAEFVLGLHKKDSSIVPHPLPSPDEFQALSEAHGMDVLDFVTSFVDDNAEEGSPSRPIYFACAKNCLQL